MSWSETTKAKSDQLNADDLIGGDIVIKITKIKINLNSDQPAIIHYEGDNGKPYKPCKSMRRVIEYKWGSDESFFVGRSLKLTRDASVKWAGEAVGGIRITHMSNLDDDSRFMLTYSKGVKRPYKVDKLKVTDDKKEKAIAWLENAKKTMSAFETLDQLTAWEGENKKIIDRISQYDGLDKDYSDFYNNLFAELSA